MIILRREKTDDIDAIGDIHRLAFHGDSEAVLVAELRANGKIVLSLVAEREGRVVGHILFSPVRIESNSEPVHALGLAPMAVLPQFQREGIGSRLVRSGLQHCRDLGHERVVVLGHADFYPRFGFLPAAGFAVTCEYDVPQEAFMVLALREGAWRGVTGTARYQPELGRV